MHLFISCAVLEICMLCFALLFLCVRARAFVLFLHTYEIFFEHECESANVQLQYIHFINQNDNNALDSTHSMYRVIYVYIQNATQYVYVVYTTVVVMWQTETNSNCKKHTMCLVPHRCAYGSCYSNIQNIYTDTQRYADRIMLYTYIQQQQQQSQQSSSSSSVYEQNI